jgi:uncharacterized protein (DUF58 family)
VKLPVPTALGVKALLFYVTLLGAFLAAPYLNLFFLLLSFLTVLGALCFLWTARSLVGVTGEVVSVAEVPAGVGPEVVARVAARRGRRPSVRLRVDLEGLGKTRLGAGTVHGETRLTGRLPPLPRGVHRLRGAAVTSTWPFGMLMVERPVPAPEEVVVYPAPAEIADAPTGSRGPSSLLASLAGVSAGQQPSHLREYRAGDEIRRMHWKASARRDDPVVTEWDGGGGNGAEVVLDRRAGPREFEAALSLLAAIVLASREAKDTLTIHTQGLSATYGSGHRPFAEALRLLASADVLPANGPPPPPASPEVLRLPAGGTAR